MPCHSSAVAFQLPLRNIRDHAGRQRSGAERAHILNLSKNQNPNLGFYHFLAVVDLKQTDRQAFLQQKWAYPGTTKNCKWEMRWSGNKAEAAVLQRRGGS